MRHDVREWLPSTALTDGAVKNGCIEVVKSWSDRWSNQPAPVVRDLIVWPDRPLSNDEYIGRTVQLPWSAKRALQLTRWALGITVADAPLTGADQLVLEALGQEIALDLAESLSRWFDMSATDTSATGEGARGRILLGLDLLDGDMRLRLAMPASGLARYRKKHCAPLPPIARPTASFPLSALPDARIEIEALLGKTPLSLRDVRSIEVGDVIRLDTKLNGTIPIFRRGHESSLFEANFAQGDDVALLTLVDPDPVSAE